MEAYTRMVVAEVTENGRCRIYLGVRLDLLIDWIQRIRKKRQLEVDSWGFG